MVVLVCFSQLTLPSNLMPSSFIDSIACSGCVPIVRTGGGVALVEAWKCVHHRRLLGVDGDATEVIYVLPAVRIVH